MAKETVTIIDYGSGNLRSAAKAFEHVGRENELDLTVKVSSNPRDLHDATRIVLPGQGAFGDCMKSLSAIDGMIDTLNESVLRQGKPFLGICVGMQLMATRGLEHGVHAGLNWIEGEVIPMNTGNTDLKIPHMGWNNLIFPSANKEQDNRHFVLRSTDSLNNFYFVHSFVFQCLYNHNVLALTEYGNALPAVVGKDNMIGVQFHPEKSQKAGLKLITEFLRWEPKPIGRIVNPQL